jgi:crotonobetainyl-CoA:carnitine CoA-transferase CaiB-like acyl-CoA transferase
LGQKAAVDTIAQAKSGIQFATGDPGSPPVMAIDSIADDMAAFALAFGLVVALYARDRLGIGQSVDCSLYGSMIRLQRWALDNYFLTGDYSGRADRGREVNPLFNRYRCKDDRWIAIAERDPQTTWPVFCTALGLQELGKECRFEGPVEKRREEGARIISILDEVFATKTYEEWEKQLNTAGDFIFSPINKAIDVGSDPQALENRYVDIFDDPNLGQVKTVGLPFLLSETPWADTSRAPELGQHTEEVLMDICDYSWEDIGKLKMQGAII